MSDLTLKVVAEFIASFILKNVGQPSSALKNWNLTSFITNDTYLFSDIHNTKIQNFELNTSFENGIMHAQNLSCFPDVSNSKNEQDRKSKKW